MTVSYQPQIFAMAFLTFAVWLVMARARLRDIGSGRIQPGDLLSSATRGSKLSDLRSSDNLANLFETPVLFYGCCLSASIKGLESPALAVTLWTYVILRCCHSWIHCFTYRIRARTNLYILSCTCLLTAYIILGLGS